DSSHTTMQAFIPGQCLFCPHPSPTFLDSVEHMQISHGLFVPQRQHLAAVDLEALFQHLHLVIFGYQECIKCGTTRASVQAVQQHMTGKGHCTFDISEPDSEFAEFYEFLSEQEDQEEEEEEMNPLSRLPVQVDEDSIRLPSGRIISKKSASLPPGPSAAASSRLRYRTRTSEIEYALGESGKDEEEEGGLSNRTEQANSETSGMQMQVGLSKRAEKRQRGMASYQLTRMSSNDRCSLMHLPVPQQRALLATQHRHEQKMQTEERRRRAKIDRKGNKNLYAYWNTETPVYQCG
ncbi:C2H2 type zinc-finger-domain-containing protein, partial [Apiosordaria backusii]